MQWWGNAVVMHVLVASFTDGDGDGIGDLGGVRDRLGYLELLGVDGLRLSPLDLAPPGRGAARGSAQRGVAPAYGDLAGFDDLLGAAHLHGLSVVLDLCPRHTSTDHPWFAAAVGAPPQSATRSRYLFDPGRAGHPPEDRPGPDGARNWSRAPGGHWYRHLGGPGRADLDWSNPEVWADLELTLRFWIDRGVDGFHLHTALGGPAVGIAIGPDHDPEHEPADGPAGDPTDGPTDGAADAADPDGHDDDPGRRREVLRAARSVLDHFPGRLMAGDAPAPDPGRADGPVPPELHLITDTRLAGAAFDAEQIQAAVGATMAAVTGTAAGPAWALSTPTTPRPPTRYGGGERGVQRSQAMLLFVLGLPGLVYLLAGDELGLPDGPGRAHGAGPVPWEGPGPAHGFSAVTPWTPLPADAEALSVAAQVEDAGSTLSLVRRAIALRRRHPAFQDGRPAVEWFGSPAGCLAYRRDGSTMVCALNASGFPVPLPPGDVLLVSGRLDGDLLPPDTTAWLV